MAGGVTMVFSPEIQELLYQPSRYMHKSWLQWLVTNQPQYAVLLRAKNNVEFHNKLLFQLLPCALPANPEILPEEHLLKIFTAPPQKTLELAFFLGIWLCADSVLKIMDGNQLRKIEAILADYKPLINQNRPHNQMAFDSVEQAMGLGVNALYQYCTNQCPEPNIWGQRLLIKLPKCPINHEPINERLGAAIYFFQNQRQIANYRGE